MTLSVLSFSGGQDSTTVLYMLLDAGVDVHCVVVNYGQLAWAEEKRASSLILPLARSHYPAQTINVEYVDCSDVLQKGVGLLQHVVPQYTDNEDITDKLKHAATFVPLRNPFLLTLCYNRAWCMKADMVSIGSCLDDMHPDNTPAFLRQFDFTMRHALGDPAPHLDAPLKSISKARSILHARTLKGCMKALSYSMTAYDGRLDTMGRDHASLTRAAAFAQANMPDPRALRLFYEARADMPSGKLYDVYKSCTSLEAALQLMGAS